MVDGRCRKVVLQVKLLLKEEVSHTPFATYFVVALTISKTFIFMHEFGLPFV
jgi:hypothetical protein